MTILSPRQQVFAFRAVMFTLVAAAGVTFVPLWAPLVLAAWVAVMARPLLLKVAKVTRGRDRAAGALVVVLVMMLLVPVGIALVSLTRGAAELGRSLLASSGAKDALIAVVSGGGEKPAGGTANALDTLASPAKILALVQEHGAQAASIASGIAGAATEALLGLFIFVYAVYVFLVDGPGYYEWFEKHAPIEVEHTRRLVAAFNETGRGLFVSVGLTGLTQGIIATITYFAIGVPRALVLGLLTCFASLIPSFGTALVWVPITIGLALAGKTWSAVIMAAVGVIVISTVDNVMRPVFARYGKLELSTFVLLTSIFGGLAMFGTWGLLLGPLFARLAKEALIMARIDRLHDKRHEIDAAAAAAEKSDQHGTDDAKAR
jgi:predicted PurR-regulated permease PerM